MINGTALDKVGLSDVNQLIGMPKLQVVYLGSVSHAKASSYDMINTTNFVVFLNDVNTTVYLLIC
jgi:hypothetical protein